MEEMLREGWPMSRLEHLMAALFDYRRCELCNGRDHRSWDCWTIDHERFVGLFDGRLEDRPLLKLYYQENWFGDGRGGPNADSRWRHLLDWAYDAVVERTDRGSVWVKNYAPEKLP